MIYVTADTHLNHKNICRGTSQWTPVPSDGIPGIENSTRPFDTLEEMNEYIIGNINSIVMPDDILIHLGDFAFGARKEIPALRDRINCNMIYLIAGNHDYCFKSKSRLYYELAFQDILTYKELRHKGILFSMSHYPLGSWNEIGKGGINLHGHCHGNYTRTIGRQMDVGIDCSNYLPMSLNDIYNIMMDVEPVLVDGHTSETNYG